LEARRQSGVWRNLMFIHYFKEDSKKAGGHPHGFGFVFEHRGIRPDDQRISHDGA